MRLLLAGQIVGAALVARHQLERWTNFLAFNTETDHRRGEDTLTYVARVWSAADAPIRQAPNPDAFLDIEVSEEDGQEADYSTGEPGLDHSHVLIGDQDICPAVVFASLSDILHCTENIDLIAWDAIDRCAPDSVPQSAVIGYLVIADALRLCAEQIRYALAGSRRPGETMAPRKPSGTCRCR